MMSLCTGEKGKQNVGVNERARRGKRIEKRYGYDRKKRRHRIRSLESRVYEKATVSDKKKPLTCHLSLVTVFRIPAARLIIQIKLFLELCRIAQQLFGRSHLVTRPPAPRLPLHRPNYV